MYGQPLEPLYEGFSCCSTVAIPYSAWACARAASSCALTA